MGSSLLDIAEAARIQGILSEMESARAKPFSGEFKMTLGANEAALRARLAELGGGSFDLSKDDERKKDAATIASAAVVMQQQEIAHYAKNGFKTVSEFFNFSDKFKDPNFVATLDALPEKEKKELAQKMVDSYNELDEGKKKKFIEEKPEAVKWLKEQGIDLSNNLTVEKIRNDVTAIAGEKGRIATDAAIVSNSSYNSVVDVKAKDAANANEGIEARAQRFLDKQGVQDIVHEAAARKNISSYYVDLEASQTAALAKLQDQGADPEAITSATKTGAKLVKKGGEVQEKDTVKPPQVAQAKDQSKDMDLSFLS